MQQQQQQEQMHTTNNGGGGPMSMDGSRTYSTARTSATNPSLLVQQQQQQQQQGQGGGGIQNGNTVVTTGGGSVLTTQNNNDHFHPQQQQQHNQQHQQLMHGQGGNSINGGDQRSVGGGSIASLQQRSIIAQPQPAPLPSFFTMCGCIECYKPSREQLEYDYTYDDVPSSNSSIAGDPNTTNGNGGNGTKSNAGGKPPQAYPRIRERGEFYIDSYNGEPWSCSFGTAEKNGTWFNSSDQAGSIMSVLVWVLMMYSTATITLLTASDGIPVTAGMIYQILCFMALACHAKTSLTDPGSVPLAAIPSERQRLLKDSHSMCGQCQTFKPPMSHHCRICNRCISRMDHHCPWMNNCVGGNNLKHFLLFLMYTWTCAAYALLLFGWNYFFCADEDCTFHPIVVHLVRVMTMLCVGAFLFTSSMLMNVCYGLMTGIGTIDRLKKKATNTMNQSDEEPIPLKEVFGIQGWWTWCVPMDPIFEDYDQAMGYCLPQRLDRERQFMEYKRPIPELQPVTSMELPRCLNDLLPV